VTPPLLLVIAGVLALAAAFVVLRTFGPSYRIGRLLAATPRVSVAEGTALAAAARPHYVRVTGRVDAEEAFEDADQRPLVIRRTTLAARSAGGSRPWQRGRWVPFETTLEAVPFVVREGLDEIAVDGRDLVDGLVVVPRESVGQVADLGDRAPVDMPATTPARLRVEQVSAVEHASVAGVPVQGSDGTVRMAPGLGRPLILTTLEDDEAMRVLAAGGVVRTRLAALLIAVAAVLFVAAVGWWVAGLLAAPATALAASPDPSLVPSDTRSSGAGPGLVGDPLFAILAVLAIGLGAVGVTLGYVRLTGRRTSG
jgi:hypothetical protein